MDKILITGGAGFLGSHLVDLLMEKGHEVYIIDNLSTGTKKNIEKWIGHDHFHFKQAALETLSPAEPFFDNIDTVFHLASKDCPLASLKNPQLYSQTNYTGTIHLLECMRRAKIKKIIYTSTYQIYGKPNLPTVENDHIRPLTPYAQSKIAAERAIEQWSFNYNIDSVILRVAEAYGPRGVFPHGEFQSWLNIWLNQKNNKIPLSIIGGSDHKRDFIYCSDVANACYTLAQSGHNREIYNIGSGNPTSFSDIIPKLSDFYHPVAGLKYFPKETWLGTSQPGFKTTWSPHVSFEKGLEFTLAHIEQWNRQPAWKQTDIEDYIMQWNNYFTS